MLGTLKRLFTEHPNSVNESYFEHAWFATKCTTKLTLAALACFVHIFLPFLFTKTASTVVADLYDRTCLNRKFQTKKNRSKK